MSLIDHPELFVFYALPVIAFWVECIRALGRWLETDWYEGDPTRIFLMWLIAPAIVFVALCANLIDAFMMPEYRD